MNVAACLLGTLLVTTPAPTLVADLTDVSGRLQPPTTFTAGCNTMLNATCRLNGTRTNWTLTAWARDGQLTGMTTQRDNDVFPVTVTTTWPRAYHSLVVQRTVTGPQWVQVAAIRTDGCQTTMRVEVR